MKPKGIRTRKYSIGYSDLVIPKGYRNIYNLEETERAIRFIKEAFQREFVKALGLTRVSAPPLVLGNSGLNDYLNGVEKPVSFKAKAIDSKIEIVQSLAKWKRNALYEYGFELYSGLYTDMNAIRPDERLDNLHSVYVDQWDWEMVIQESDRNIDFLKKVVKKIYDSIRKTELDVIREFRKNSKPLCPEEIFFIHSEELYDMYPGISPKEREYRITKEKKAVFIIGIGSELPDGKPHDGRAADYDDWSSETYQNRRGLNGDIIVYYPLLDIAFELSSMGIRINKKSLLYQLRLKNELDKRNLPFHQRLIKGILPQSIGGGIGQSRLCMFYLRKAHIGEVQVSVWPNKVKSLAKSNNIMIL